MPFNFYEPKPLEVYDHPHGRRRRYWPYPKYLEHLDYTPEEIRSWGSIGHQPDIHHVPPHHTESTRKNRCSIKCKNIKAVNRYYPEQYIRDKLMLENPGLLPALKNTHRVRDVPQKPIAFTAPRFVHTNERSQYHLLVREKDRSGLCEVARNLQQEQQKIRDMMRASHIGRKMLLRADASQSALSTNEKREGGKSVKSTKSVPKGDAKGKKILKAFFDSKIQLPIPSQIPKDVTQYNWSEEGGMESLCKNYPGKSLFVESPSNLPLAQQPEFAEMLDGPMMNARKTIALVNQAHPAVGKIKKFTPPPQSSKDPILSSRAYEEFNHYGLLESAKHVALEHILKQLYRREPHVTVPKELLGTSYGALKGAPPGYKFDKPQVPEYLHEDWYPEPEELDQVERAMKYESQQRKTRKARGMQSQANITSYLSQFTKPLVTESAEDVSIRTYKKLSLQPTVALETHDSSESLIYKVAEVMIEGQPQIEIPPLTPERSSTEILIEVEAETPILENHEVMRKSVGEHAEEMEEEEDDEEEEGESEGESVEEGDETQELMKPHDHFEGHMLGTSATDEEEDENEDVDEIPSNFAMLTRKEEMGEEEEEVEDLSEFRDGGSLVVQDSSEFLPYPDVTFSVVALPFEVKGIEKSGLYRKLAEDERSGTSEDEDEEEEEEEEMAVDPSRLLEDDDDDDLDDEEEEEEETSQNDDDAPMVQVTSGTSIALDQIFMRVQTFLERKASQRVRMNRGTTIIE